MTTLEISLQRLKSHCKVCYAIARRAMSLQALASSGICCIVKVLQDVLLSGEPHDLLLSEELRDHSEEEYTTLPLLPIIPKKSILHYRFSQKIRRRVYYITASPDNSEEKYTIVTLLPRIPKESIL